MSKTWNWTKPAYHLGFFLGTFKPVRVAVGFDGQRRMIDDALKGLAFLVGVTLKQLQHGSLGIGQSRQVGSSPHNRIHFISFQKLNISGVGGKREEAEVGKLTKLANFFNSKADLNVARVTCHTNSWRQLLDGHIVWHSVWHSVWHPVRHSVWLSLQSFRRPVKNASCLF